MFLAKKIVAITSILLLTNQNVTASDSEPFFQCSLPPFHVDIFNKSSGDAYGPYQAHVYHNSDLEFSDAEVSWEGSGSCRYMIWDFKYFDEPMKVQTLGCGPGEIVVPEDALGEIKIGEYFFWCY